MRRHLRGADSDEWPISETSDSGWSGARGEDKTGEGETSSRRGRRSERPGKASASPPAGTTTGCNKADRKPGGPIRMTAQAVGRTEKPGVMSPGRPFRWSAGAECPKSPRRALVRRPVETTRTGVASAPATPRLTTRGEERSDRNRKESRRGRPQAGQGGKKEARSAARRDRDQEKRRGGPKVRPGRKKRGTRSQTPARHPSAAMMERALRPVALPAPSPPGPRQQSGGGHCRWPRPHFAL
jgi:hypothetical protein